MPEHCRRQLAGVLLGIALLAVLLPVLGDGHWLAVAAMLAIWALAAWGGWLLRQRLDVLPEPPVEQPDHGVGAFLSSMGHDLRQPMQAASLFAATLSAHPLPESSRKLVQGMESALHQLSEQLEAVFALAKLQAGRVHCECVPVPLAGIMADAVHSHLDEAHEQGLHLRHVPSRQRVCADEALLRRVLDRMLSHARAVAGEGGVLLGCRRQGGTLRLEVHAGGAGVEPALASLAFTPGSAYGQNLDDRGLGLVLARQLALRMDGELTLESLPTRGRILRLSLPYAA